MVGCPGLSTSFLEVSQYSSLAARCAFFDLPCTSSAVQTVGTGRDRVLESIYIDVAVRSSSGHSWIQYGQQ